MNPRPRKKSTSINLHRHWHHFLLFSTYVNLSFTFIFLPKITFQDKSGCNWFQGQAFCKSMGGYLAEITSEAEQVRPLSVIAVDPLKQCVLKGQEDKHTKRAQKDTYCMPNQCLVDLYLHQTK